ncbi:hypothetical protein R3P38DRAFT_2839010 [Favolaschia claudopus]|uniref:Uncharacterized protein n=1 Tax=Favolaschia claudopus TaxID=2862362 RepID=A0AAW0EAS5_9AGAR
MATAILAPAIGSSALPSTPANEWAASTNGGILDVPYQYNSSASLPALMKDDVRPSAVPPSPSTNVALAQNITLHLPHAQHALSRPPPISYSSLTTDTSLSKLSTQAQAGSCPNLSPPQTQSSTAPLNHEARCRSAPHHPIPLPDTSSSADQLPSSSSPRPSASSSAVDISPTSTSKFVEDFTTDIDITAFGAPDALTPPAPEGVIDANKSSSSSSRSTPPRRRRSSGSSDNSTSSGGSGSDNSLPRRLVHRLKEKMHGVGHHAQE